MAWQKRALKVSALWVGLVFSLAVFGLWCIAGSNDPSMPLSGFEQSRKLGQETFGFLVLGLAAI